MSSVNAPGEEPAFLLSVISPKVIGPAATSCSMFTWESAGLLAVQLRLPSATGIDV